MTCRTKVLAVLTALAALLLGTMPAEARKVANPTNFIGEVTDGTIRIKTTSLDLANLEPHIMVKGPIGANGVITIPRTRLGSAPTASSGNGIFFPDIPLAVDGTTYSIRAIPTHDWTGNVNPMTGAMNMRIRFRLEIRGGQLGTDGSCKIGTDSNPLDLIAPNDASRDLRTGRTTPPGPNTPIEGREYNPDTGTVLIVNNEAAVNQTANGCGPLGLGNGPLNDALGLPSSAGNNEAQLDINWSKVVTPMRKAVNAAFTATPSSGSVPLATSFNGASSFAQSTTAPANSISTYRWDFNNDGTFDTAASTSPTASTSYTTPGTYTARLRVTDNEGDFDDTTRTITVLPKPPNLSLAKSHTGNFRVGTEGPLHADGRQRLVAHLRPHARRGDHHRHPSGGHDVRRFGRLGLVVQRDGPRRVVHEPVPHAAAAERDLVGPAAGHADGGRDRRRRQHRHRSRPSADSDPSNDSASDPTTVDGIDLALTKTHPGGAFQIGQTGRYYALDITNRGTSATVGSTTVTDVLPPGITFDNNTGSGWAPCTVAGQQVTCVRTTAIPAGATTQLRLYVTIGGAPRDVVNTATVATADDVDASNNTSSDPTPIFETPDLAITKTDVGEFRVGGEAVYTLGVTNAGVESADGTTTITDALPTGLTYTSATGTGWSCSETDGTVKCTRTGELARGAAFPPVTLRAAIGAAAAPVDSEAPEITNTGTVELAPAAGTDGDPNAANDSASVTSAVKRVDLTLDKSHTGAFRVGSQGAYTLVVRNRGTLPATGRTAVVDTLPEGMDYVSAEGDGWLCSPSGAEVTCARTQQIPAGASAPPISLVVALQPASAPSKTNTATVSNPADQWPSNNDASDPTAVTQVDLALRTSSSPTGTWRVGQTRSYTFSVSNSGIASTGPTTVTSTLPAGVELVSVSGLAWTCSAAGQAVTCVRSLLVGAQSDVPPITLVGRLTPKAVPEVTVLGAVATAGDTSLLDNQHSVTNAVVGPDLAIDLSPRATSARWAPGRTSSRCATPAAAPRPRRPWCATPFPPA
jgi:uncharacterized repeat protein (TIGR01451 family)